MNDELKKIARASGRCGELVGDVICLRPADDGHDHAPCFEYVVWWKESRGAGASRWAPVRGTMSDATRRFAQKCREFPDGEVGMYRV